MWKIAKLSDVCKIQSGNSIPVKEKEVLYRNVNEGLPYVATKDVGFDGVIDYENGVRIPPDHSSKFRLSKKNSILVCAEGGSAGRKIAFSNKDCHFVNKLFSISPGSEMVSKYVYYYTLSNNFQSQFKEVMHGLIGGVSLLKIKDFQITHPPFSEQQRIVAKLDTAFAKINMQIATIKKSMVNNKNLINAVLSKIFKNEKEIWKNYSLNDVCIVERGSSPRPIKKFITENNGVNWIKISDTCKDGKYVSSTRQKITKEGAKKSRYVAKGDFILTNSMSYGRPYIMATDGYIHDGWFVLRLNSEIDTNFFYYLLSSPIVQNQFSSLAAGAVVSNISGDLVKKTMFPIPPKNKQIEIRKQIESIEKNVKELSNIKDRQFKNYQFLKSAILTQELQIGPT